MCARNSIDRLPEDVLISIALSLPVLEAVRARVLGRKWRNLWMFSSVLNFDATKVINKLKKLQKRKHLDLERITYAEWVNKVIDSHLGSTIDEFRIFFDLDSSFDTCIDKWLQFAFSKRVKRLELDLVMSYSGIPNAGSRLLSLITRGGRYSFPNVCDPIERMHFFPCGLSSCESLVMLRLTEVDVTGEVLEFFISNCPLLEELLVKDTNRLESLRATCLLRHLTIIKCNKLEIFSPNLLSFTFSGSMISLALENASSLVALSLEARQPKIFPIYLNQISGGLSRLEALMLQTTSSLLPKYKMLSRLPSLKQLVLDVCACGPESILCFTPLIDVAPLLREIQFFSCLYLSENLK